MGLTVVGVGWGWGNTEINCGDCNRDYIYLDGQG